MLLKISSMPNRNCLFAGIYSVSTLLCMVSEKDWVVDLLLVKEDSMGSGVLRQKAGKEGSVGPANIDEAPVTAPPVVLQHCY